MERYYNESAPYHQADAEFDVDSIAKAEDVDHHHLHLHSDNDNDNDEGGNNNNNNRNELLNDGADGDEKDEDEDNSGNSSSEQFVIKLRGLPWSATEDELTAFLEPAHVTATHLLQNAAGRPSGEAFVELESHDDVDLALSKDKEYMGKRYVEVYTASASDMYMELRRQNDAGGRGEGSDADRCVVKLRGLPFAATDQDILDFFEGLEVDSSAPGGGVLLVREPSGRASGEAFVRFATPQHAASAMDKHKQRIGHRYVEIFTSSTREMNIAAGPPPSHPGYPPSLFGSHHHGPPHHHPHRGPPPPGYNRYDGYAPPPHHYGGPPPPPGPHHHHGYGGRPTPYDRPPAPYSSSGRSGRLKGPGGYPEPAYPPPPPPPHRYHGDAGYGSHHYHDYPPPPHGRGGYPPPPPPPPPHHYPRHGQPGAHRVRMRGLPYSATQQDIYEFFHPMVPIDVHFVYQSNGKFSGEVDAEFRSHEEATDAMRYDRKYIDKRYIELFLFSQPPPSSPGMPMSAIPPPPGAGGAQSPPGGSLSRSSPGGNYAGGYTAF